MLDSRIAINFGFSEVFSFLLMVVNSDIIGCTLLLNKARFSAQCSQIKSVLKMRLFFECKIVPQHSLRSFIANFSLSLGYKVKEKQ